jgi:opacity protein-like surface antigen
MKKIVIASALALASVASMAAEVGITAGRDFAGTDQNVVGITLTEKISKNVGLIAGFERTEPSNFVQNRFSLGGSYGLFSVGKATVAAKAGVAYLDNATVVDGWAAAVGVGADVPLTKTVSATVDYRYQGALQDRVKQFDGSNVAFGLKYKF